MEGMFHCAHKTSAIIWLMDVQYVAGIYYAGRIQYEGSSSFVICIIGTSRCVLGREVHACFCSKAQPAYTMLIVT